MERWLNMWQGIIEDIIGSDLCIDIHSSNIFVNEMPQVRINDDTRKSFFLMRR